MAVEHNPYKGGGIPGSWWGCFSHYQPTMREFGFSSRGWTRSLGPLDLPTLSYVTRSTPPSGRDPESKDLLKMMGGRSSGPMSDLNIFSPSPGSVPEPSMEQQPWSRFITSRPIPLHPCRGEGPPRPLSPSNVPLGG